MEKINKAYMLVCTGSEVFFDGKFKAICKSLFKENPLETDKYKEEIDKFLGKCFDKEHNLSVCEEGTEKLSVVEMEVI